MTALNTVIYADILVVINIIINYLLLRAAAAITACEFRALRFLAASALAGIFSLIIFIDNMPLWLSIIVKIAFLLIMVFVAFGAKSVKAFVKCFAAFFIANFVFAGIMLAVCTFLLPNAAMYKNGVVYFDIDILTLTVSAIVCYIILSILSRLTRSRVPQKCIYHIKITAGEKSVEGKALFDSGNTLCDCFSGKPVIIAENDFVKSLYEKTQLSDMKNFRLIPFSTIKDGGALPAFMADEVEIEINEFHAFAKEIYIAVTDKKIVSGGYSALLGVPVFDAVEYSIKRGSAAERGRIKG